MLLNLCFNLNKFKNNENQTPLFGIPLICLSARNLNSNLIADSTYTKLKDDVEKLEAEIEVTQEYYSKREIEISAQLGTETSTRSQSEEIHAKQMSKENRLKDQLDKFKNQVSTLEKKWEVEDSHHTASVTVCEENRSRNQYSLMESESKLGQIVVSRKFKIKSIFYKFLK